MVDTKSHIVTHSQIPSGVARAHAELLTHQDLQFDFPKYDPPVTPQWMIDLGKFLGRIWPHARYLVWAAVAIALLYLAYLVVREIQRRGWFGSNSAAEIAPTELTWLPVPEVARNLLKDADALAANGQFADAAHLLLLRSIEHINEQKPNLVTPALTSREIGRLSQLPNAPRAAFSNMVGVVEHILFAGHDISALDFAQCREAYERFAFPAYWAGVQS